MTRPTLSILVVLAAAVAAGPSSAQCPPTYAVPGGGSPRTDCAAEFGSPGLVLNFPPFNPAAPRLRREVRCFDGDAGCDLDGAVNGVCEFPIDVCLRNADPALPACTPADVTAVTVRNKPVGHPKHLPALAALQSAIDALLPATSCSCTSGRTVSVPLRRGIRKGRLTVRLLAVTASGVVDRDRVRLACMPRAWPSHGYNHANHRATPVETKIGPSNVDQLVTKWLFDLGTGVTSTPTVGDGRVYVTAWNGRAYALRETDGTVLWEYATGAPSIQSSATLTADGRVLFGDSSAGVHCLHAKTGAVLWTRSLEQLPADHIWASPTVANNRVFVGIASHTDQPCTQGRLVALDLDTGEELWTRRTVPDRVCNNDTSILCAEDADCGAGTCVLARGAGVTATVAVDRTGETLFMNTVGCYTFPSIGDSDSIFRLEAATGAADWITRVDAPEQFRACSNDGSVDCVSDADCVAPGTCATKVFYHDFGFLNGPILIDPADGPGGVQPLVVSGSKNGTLYALDPADGSTVWTHAVRPKPVTPAFAGFGLFNGAIGFAGQRLHAALYDFIPALNPAPIHLMAFGSPDGTLAWEADVDIGLSWGSVAVANGVVYTGALPQPARLYAYDAITGVRLAALETPSPLTSGASIVNGSVYVGYGIVGSGGVKAFTLP